MKDVDYMHVAEDSINKIKGGAFLTRDVMNKINLLLLMVSILLLISCSSKPPQEYVEKKLLDTSYTYTCSQMQTFGNTLFTDKKDINLGTITYGEYNKKFGWHVKANVKCGKGGEKETHVFFRKNDFGEWESSVNGVIFSK